MSKDIVEKTIYKDLIDYLNVILLHAKSSKSRIAAAWSLGQAGGHDATTAQEITENGSLLALIKVHSEPTADVNIREACLQSLRKVVLHLESINAFAAALSL